MRARASLGAPRSGTSHDKAGRRSSLQVPYGFVVALLMLMGVSCMMLVPREDQSRLLHWNSPQALMATAINAAKNDNGLSEADAAPSAPRTQQQSSGAVGSMLLALPEVAGTFLQKRVPECPAGDRSGLFHNTSTHTELFERLSTDPKFSAFQPVVLSRDPWILQFDALYTEEECKGVVEECGKFHVDAVATGATRLNYRNSSSFACRNGGSCNDKPAFYAYRKRMADVLNVGLEHGEGIQILKYLEGGFYGKHHDFVAIPQDPDYEICGPRVLTFMTYLNDVEEGGSTSFFHLGIDVRPKIGRALLWADTFNNSPLDKDERTAHEALLVKKGSKYTATTWFQQYDRDANVKAQCCAECVGCARPAGEAARKQARQRELKSRLAKAGRATK